MMLAVNMKCKCAKLDVRVSGYREDNYFKSFPELKQVNDGWRVILKCPECGQHWLVDIFDRVQYLYAYKIDSAEPLQDGEYYKIHKEQLEKSRNGYSNENCAIAGCNNKALKTLAYCAGCAINKFGIYE